MKIKILILMFSLFALLLSACGNKQSAHETVIGGKPALMWIDATANFSRFQNKDSIEYYLQKIKLLGFTHAIVDVRPITGEVLYDSKIAPRMEEWNGIKRGDFDYLGCFIEQGHKLGLEIYASINVFCAGHNYINRGIVYSQHPEWVSMVYDIEKGIVPITEMKQDYGAMINPVNDEYQTYILSILIELITKYPFLDGIMLDRVRYDGIRADFSDLSRKKFEEYIGEEIANFPADILSWQKDENGEYKPAKGKYALKWIEWRAKTIYDFMIRACKIVKRINPEISFGTYTGAWYPSYYEVGVNFASNTYDPSCEYDWATSEYKNYGYAEIIDLYITGNYYTDITIEEYDKERHVVRNETDSQWHMGTWYCVEGSCQNLREIMGDNKFIGGVLVNLYYDNPEKLTKAVATNLLESDGLMVFDIVHIIDHELWDKIEEGMKAGKAL